MKENLNMKGAKNVNSFNFGRKVEICGEIYYLSKDMKKNAAAMKKCSDKMFELADARHLTPAGMMDEVRKQSKETIDTVLGTGSFDKIFAKEEADLINLVSLVNFITDEINQWKAELEAMSVAGRSMIEKRSQK